MAGAQLLQNARSYSPSRPFRLSRTSLITRLLLDSDTNTTMSSPSELWLSLSTKHWVAGRHRSSDSVGRDRRQIKNQLSSNLIDSLFQGSRAEQRAALTVTAVFGILGPAHLCSFLSSCGSLGSLSPWLCGIPPSTCIHHHLLHWYSRCRR